MSRITPFNECGIPEGYACLKYNDSERCDGGGGIYELLVALMQQKRLHCGQPCAMLADSVRFWHHRSSAIIPSLKRACQHKYAEQEHNIQLHAIWSRDVTVSGVQVASLSWSPTWPPQAHGPEGSSSPRTLKPS